MIKKKSEMSQYTTKTFETKSQLISKADWRAIDSPKKRMDEFVLVAFLLFTANKSNSSVRFLGESTAHQSTFWFYPTFKKTKANKQNPLQKI